MQVKQGVRLGRLCFTMSSLTFLCVIPAQAGIQYLKMRSILKKYSNFEWTVINYE